MKFLDALCSLALSKEELVVAVSTVTVFDGKFIIGDVSSNFILNIFSRNVNINNASEY